MYYNKEALGRLLVVIMNITATAVVVLGLVEFPKSIPGLLMFGVSACWIVISLVPIVAGIYAAIKELRS